MADFLFLNVRTRFVEWLISSFVALLLVNSASSLPWFGQWWRLTCATQMPILDDFSSPQNSACCGGADFYKCVRQRSAAQQAVDQTCLSTRSKVRSAASLTGRRKGNLAWPRGPLEFTGFRKQMNRLKTCGRPAMAGSSTWPLLDFSCSSCLRTGGRLLSEELRRCEQF